MQTREQVILEYSYGITEDYSELVEKLRAINAREDGITL